MQKLQYDTIYELSFEEMKIPFCSDSQLVECGQNGTFMSSILERIISNIFPQLQHKPSNGYDFIPTDKDLKKIDQKSFTNGGLKIMPSSMIGKGRIFDKKVFLEHAAKTDYFITDITEFPNVKMILKSGKELSEKYPRGNVSITRKQDIFLPNLERIKIEEKIHTAYDARQSGTEQYIPGPVLHQEVCR